MKLNRVFPVQELKVFCALVLALGFVLLGNWNGHRQADIWWQSRAEPEEHWLVKFAYEHEGMPLVFVLPERFHPAVSIQDAFDSLNRDYAGTIMLISGIYCSPDEKPWLDVGPHRTAIIEGAGQETVIEKRGLDAAPIYNVHDHSTLYLRGQELRGPYGQLIRAR